MPSLYCCDGKMNDDTASITMMMSMGNVGTGIGGRKCYYTRYYLEV